MYKKMAAALASVASWAVIASDVLAADMPVKAPPAYKAAPAPAIDMWQFRFTPYGWFINTKGDMTARGRTIGVDATFIDLVENSDSILAWMSYAEARKGRLAFYADIVWSKLDFSGSQLTQRNPIAGLTIDASLGGGLKQTMFMAEVGATYELARWGSGGAATKDMAHMPASFTALDVLAGARYWYQSVELSLAITGIVNLPALGLQQIGGLAVAKSGGIDWIDPIIGLRLRHQIAPGRELQLRGDIGGFGVGSDFTWQLFAGYGQDCKIGNMTIHAVLGYRAIGIDYSKGSDISRIGLDVVMHGPVLGTTFRW